MTYVYGATLLETAHHIENYAITEMGVTFPEGENVFKWCQYAARKLFYGIASTAPAAAAAMQWLRDVAKQQPRGKRMEWASPTGFLVQHDYQTFDEVRVRIRSCGLQTVIVRNYNEGTNPLEMQNAVSPNFVHALDAAHLTFTALAMKRKGLDFVGIHDSFGTHLCDIGALHACIRSEFVSMYQDKNIFGAFLWDIGAVGEPPMRGTLDLKDVMESEFFFC